MKVLLQAVGSRGDVQPFVALARGLAAAGHEPLLCAGKGFAPLLAAHGVPHAPMADDLVELLQSDAGRKAVEKTRGLGSALATAWRTRKAIGPMNQRLLRESWDAARRFQPDAIVFHPKAIGGPDFGHELQVPALAAVLQPLLAPTGDFPCMGLPALPLGRGYNRLTHRLAVKLTDAALRGPAKSWRREAGLPARPRGLGIARDAQGRARVLLQATSARVAPRPADWPRNVIQTGYWFLPAEQDWTPPPALEAFLATGPPPVCIGFGSMAGRDPAGTTRLVLEAVRLAGVRAVLVTGWGGLDKAGLPGDVLAIDAAPHDWLFPRVAAVAHHGGAGTTAAGLRAGCPTVVCPFIIDQFYWGERVRALGAGPAPVPQRRMTAQALGAALREAATSESMRERAGLLGESLRAEDGVARAVEAIEAAVAGRSRASYTA